VITRISIENCKSIQKLELDLGRVNVLIGENGCGKTNILEAIAFAGAAASAAEEDEFLAHRGIRATEARFMRPAFAVELQGKDIRVAGAGTPPLEFDLTVRDAPSPLVGWRTKDSFFKGDVRKAVGEGPVLTEEILTDAIQFVEERRVARYGPLLDFRIYAPESSALRRFQDDSRVSPVSVDGTGLYAHLKALSAGERSALFAEIIDRLALLDWFEKLEIPSDLVASEHRIDIRDRYLAAGALFDQRSANEGFLFLLFYFTLLISPDTPKFFAIDNIDTSLNPLLCAEVMRQIVELARKHDKQVILTTHNPATLDGLKLQDDEQRLLVVYRSITDGDTMVRRVGPPKRIEGVTPVSLSEAFMRGYIGGLPNNF
jgi:predicted ATPase